jgi:hypothetical protein
VLKAREAGVLKAREAGVLKGAQRRADKLATGGSQRAIHL